jgi:hypothetical protein
MTCDHWSLHRTDTVDGVIDVVTSGRRLRRDRTGAGWTRTVSHHEAVRHGALRDAPAAAWAVAPVTLAPGATGTTEVSTARGVGAIGLSAASNDSPAQHRRSHGEPAQPGSTPTWPVAASPTTDALTGPEGL